MRARCDDGRARTQGIRPARDAGSSELAEGGEQRVDFHVGQVATALIGSQNHDMYRVTEVVARYGDAFSTGKFYSEAVDATRLFGIRRGR